MKGNNKLKINQATMTQAIQQWLDSEFKFPPRAISVSKVSGEYEADEFEILLTDEPIAE